MTPREPHTMTEHDMMAAKFRESQAEQRRKDTAFRDLAVRLAKQITTRDCAKTYPHGCDCSICDLARELLKAAGAKP